MYWKFQPDFDFQNLLKEEATSQNLEELEKASYELLSLLDTEKDVDLIAHVKSRVDFWSETISSNMEQNEVSSVSGGTPRVPHSFHFHTSIPFPSILI